MKNYVYFVTFNISRGRTSNYGNIIITRKKEIATLEDIREVESIIPCMMKLKKNKSKYTTILQSFQLLRVDEVKE